VNSVIKNEASAAWEEFEKYQVGRVCVVNESGEAEGMIRLVFGLDLLLGDVRENILRLWEGSNSADLQEMCDQIVEMIAACLRRNPEFIVWMELMTDQDSALLVDRFSELDPSNIVHRTFVRMIMEGPGTDDVGELEAWLRVTREEELRKAALEFREPAEIRIVTKKKIPDLPKKDGDAYRWVLAWEALEPKLKQDPTLKIDLPELMDYLRANNLQMKEDTIKKIIVCGMEGKIPSLSEFERRASVNFAEVSEVR
jgi:hypothetical protein